MKLTDALAKILQREKIKNVFGLQGGAVIHIFDSIEKTNIKVTYTHHEAAAALAATANAKVLNNIGCVVVTTGPGCTNAITGLLAAWQDSVPCIFISGQARSNHVSYGLKVRQVGTQEVNICDIVKPITKYSKFIDKKENFIKEISKAIKIAKSGRPGPVWIDIPLDLQWSEIKFKYDIDKKINQKIKQKEFKSYNKSLDLIKNSKKPIFVLGFGVRTSNIQIKKIKEYTKKYNIPFVCTWNSSDLIATKNDFNLGTIGMSGQRGANKAIFDSDLIVCLGTHLAIPHTTTLYDSYVKKAKKIIVNIDNNQINNLNLKFDLKICCDVKKYFDWLYRKKINKKDWNNKKIYKGMNWYEPLEKKLVNSNSLIHEVTKKIKEKMCVIVDGGGTALYAAHQSSEIKERDRIICSSAISSMGTGLAETLGVGKSGQFKKHLCIIGDGSFLMNIQDLQSIVQNKINVAILLINNNGYLAIRHSQKEFLKGRYYGTHPKWNLEMPSFEKVTKSFNLNYEKLDNIKDKKKIIDKIVKNKSPTVYEIIIDENQSSLFKQGYLKNREGVFIPQPLSEMFPYLNKSIANTNN
jgi:acetolactate synthase I/II/III large subunit|tara:strand:- start:2262 stop:4001 length:1740 start_codon:yes stop_codon:yes gene_type:complete